VLPLWYCAPLLFRLIGHEPAVQVCEVVYFQRRLWGVGAAVAAWGLGSYFQGIHKPWVAFAATVAANLANLALAWALIFGKLGFPALGIRGAGLATSAAACLQAVLLLGVLLQPRFARVFGGLDTCRFDWTKLKQLVRIGWPAGLNFFLDVATWAFFVNVLIGRFGNAQLAGNNLAEQYLHLSFMPAMGLSAAATALMGKYIGRGEPQRAKARAYMCLRIAMAYMTTMGALFLLFRYPLARVFSDDPEVIRCGAMVLIFAAIFQTMDAVGIVSSGALRGAGDTHWAAAITIGSSWGVFLPLGLALVHFRPSLGAVGPWIAATVYIFLIGGLLFRRLASDQWRRIDIFAVRREATPLVDEP
jgi:MATE family multidrug resistance protein